VVIGEEALYIVSEHRKHGVTSGLFLTNLAPGEVGTEALLAELWSRQFGEDRVRGVVVLRRNLEALPIKRSGRGEWVHPAPPGTVLDLTEVLVGYAIRPRGRWLWSDDL
jgi:hypothetical protein